MTYDAFVALLQGLQATDSSDTDFNAVIPTIINQAELMIYRDLDPVYARKYDQALTVTAGTALVPLPSDCWVLRKITLTLGGQRVEVTPRQKSYLEEFWPDFTVAGTPKHYATPQEGYVFVVPPPGGGTVLKADYTYRPATATTGGTDWVLTNYPDLCFYAAALWIGGWSKAYAGEDPRGPGYWQGLYDRELAKARIEEARKKGEPPQEQGPTAPLSRAGG